MLTWQTVHELCLSRPQAASVVSSLVAGLPSLSSLVAGLPSLVGRSMFRYGDVPGTKVLGWFWAGSGLVLMLENPPFRAGF